MSIVQYSPEDWLTSCTRSLVSYIASQFASDPHVEVESSFPSLQQMEKWTPLPKALIHVNRDDVENPVLGFGTPGVEVYDSVAGSWRIDEAAVHLVNYDMGVWVSAAMGGETKRMQIVQSLTNLFSTASAKKRVSEATGGLWVQSFAGGRDDVDRINELPVWRAMDMTLILRVVSRHPTPEEVVPEGFDQVQSLTINDVLI